MMKHINIILADDHKMVREGLKSIIEKQPDMKIIAEASNGVSAISLSKQYNPDVVVMDISMPDINGIDATKKIIHVCPKTRVMILSMHADSRFVKEAVNAGALGYVLKDSASEELIFAIRKVYNGEAFLSSKITENMIKNLNNTGTEINLSSRELEVLKFIAEGLATKSIASKLGISAKTVEAHRHQIMEKLQIHSVAELTKYAIREGITNA